MIFPVPEERIELSVELLLDLGLPDTGPPPDHRLLVAAGVDELFSELS
jgi:hypothetical protein